ncbi:MAG: DUF2891 domain-containing protein [Aeoliella sp.]
MNNVTKLFLASATLMSTGNFASAAELPHLGKPLNNEQVAAFAQLAVENIEREYPNKLSHVWTGEELARDPHELHPVFYGSFDWHSSVHGHWMLVRLLKLYPQTDISSKIRPLLQRQLTAEKLVREAEYFQKKSNRTYERMYGWAWALRLAQELHTWDDPQARAWAKNYSVLEKQIVTSIHDYLPRLTYPVRTGVHPDTAFALALILDYARAVDDQKLAQLVVSYAMEKYASDKDYPANYEPSGQDFFSAGLNQADLMRRVMEQDDYSRWLEKFLPALEKPNSKASTILQPAIVSDVTDPQIVHLVGLNLSRGWTQRGIASALLEDDPRRLALENAATAHCQAGLNYVFSGHYEGEHWLATFAVYLLTDAGIETR